jgi:sterol desaturase/sphingolipid hydroxylase (fatty acid hydroxylase superfamily)
MVRRFVSALLFPLLVAGITAIAVYGSTFDLATPLGFAPDAKLALLSLAAIVPFYTAVALLERIHPYRPAWNHAAGDQRTDLLHLLFTDRHSVCSATLRGVATSGAVWLAAQLGASLWPASLPALAQLYVAILVAEFGHYGFHRLSHENPWVWRLHATHHSAPRLYWLNATRFHPLDLFCLIACQNLPLILLGAPPRVFAMYVLFSIVYGQLQHGNIELRTRALDWLFSTPGLHRFHHSTDTREGNANYGAILIGWDLVFRSFFRPRDRGFEGPVGIRALPAFPQRYFAQLASPFRWSRIERESGRSS